MKSFKDDIFNRIRDDYIENGENSVLYQYILKNEIKEDVLKKDEKFIDEEVRKLAKRRMYDYGYPITGKESSRSSNNSALNLIDEFLREKSDERYFDDFDPEPYEILYNVLNEEKNTTAFIPVRIDNMTGIGYYIIGKDHYGEFPESYKDDNKTCGIGFITNWQSWCPDWNEKRENKNFYEYDEYEKEDICLTFENTYSTDNIYEKFAKLKTQKEIEKEIKKIMNENDLIILNDLPNIYAADIQYRKIVMKSRFTFFESKNGPRNEKLPKLFDPYFAGGEAMEENFYDLSDEEISESRKVLKEF